VQKVGCLIKFVSYNNTLPSSHTFFSFIFPSAVHLVNLLRQSAHQVNRRVSMLTVLQTNTALHLVAVNSVAKTLQAHPIPRRWTIVSVMSITTALMGTVKKKKGARFALFIPPAPRMGPRSLTASVTSITLL
jgi:hypothetical protein